MRSIAQYLDRLPADERKLIEALPEHQQWDALGGLFVYKSLRSQVDQVAARTGSAHGRELAPVELGTLLAAMPKPTVKDSRHLRVYSELHPKLVEAGLAGPTMIWDALKWHARKRRGRHLYTSGFIVRLISRLWGWSGRRVLRYLRDGEGKLWSCSPGKHDRRERIYHIFGLARVTAAALRSRHPGRQTNLAFAAYRGNVNGYRRAIWEVFTAARNHAARSVQAGALGVSESTIYAWQRISTLNRQERSVRAPEPQNQRQLEELTDTMDRAGVSLDPEDDRAPAWQSKRGHTYWQTTNAYSSDDVRLEKGRSGFIRFEADNVLSRAKGQLQFFGTACDDQQPMSTYIEPFDDAERAVRHQERRKNEAVLVLDRKTRGAIPRRAPSKTHAYTVSLAQYRLEYSLASYGEKN